MHRRNVPNNLHFHVRAPQTRESYRRPANSAAAREHRPAPHTVLLYYASRKKTRTSDPVWVIDHSSVTSRPGGSSRYEEAEQRPNDACAHARAVMVLFRRSSGEKV
jgi:hypothetical protein